MGYGIIRYKLSDFQCFFKIKVHDFRIPKKLYKFISFNGDEKLVASKMQSLKEESVWFQNIELFNDIFENKAAFVDNDLDSSEELYFLFEFFKNFTYAFCMTEDGVNNLSMWGNYGDSFKGICVEYNVISTDAIHPVEYIDKPICINIQLNKVNELCDRYRETQNKEDQKLLFTFFNFLYGYSNLKSKHWGHEKEYRILAKYGFDDSKVFIKEYAIKSNNSIKGFNVPLKELGLEVNAVYITSKCEPNIENKLKEIFHEKLKKLATKKDSFELIETNSD